MRVFFLFFFCSVEIMFELFMQVEGLPDIEEFAYVKAEASANPSKNVSIVITFAYTQ